MGFNNTPVLINIFRWIESEWFNIIWGFLFDSLTVSMLIPVLIISSLVHIYSVSYMSADPHNQRFFSYLSLFTFMMLILVTGNNYLLMFVGWEGVGVCSYLLVSFWFTRIAANQSSISAFLTNRVGDAFLTVGMFAILWTLGNLDYATVFSLAPYINENIVTIIGICLLIGAMAKSSQVGLHVWLPMAMEGPTPVSALIHAATMVTAGVYLLIRSSPLIEYSSTVLLLCLWLGAITTVFSSLIGLFQQDIKKVIAYSTMSQLGMMVIAIGLSSYNLALFHLVNHAFYKGLLFLGAGAVIHAVNDNQDFRRYGGLISYLPLTYSVMLIASLSLVAFPFMTGFYSKDFILESAFGQYSFSGIAVYIIAVIGAIFTTLYSVKVLYLTFLTSPNGPNKFYDIIYYAGSTMDSYIAKRNLVAHEGNIFLSLPLVVLAIFSIFFGYITKDIFIGLGTSFFIDNSIFIHPVNEITIDTEFAVATIFKLLPLIFTISFTVIAIVVSEFLGENLIAFKFSKLGYKIFGFFNQRFLIELFYNTYITNLVLTFGGQTTKVLDKGSVEFIGPYGLELVLQKFSKQISSLNTTVIPNYALTILIGFIFNLVIYSSENVNLIIILIFSILFLIFLDSKDNTKSFETLESSLFTVQAFNMLNTRYYSSSSSGDKNNTSLEDTEMSEATDNNSEQSQQTQQTQQPQQTQQQQQPQHTQQSSLELESESEQELEFRGPEISPELRNALLGNRNERLMDFIINSNRERRDNPLDSDSSESSWETESSAQSPNPDLEDTNTRKLDSSSEQENPIKKIKISKDDNDGNGDGSSSSGNNNTGGDNGPDMPESTSSKVISYLLLSFSGAMCTLSEVIGNLF